MLALNGYLHQLDSWMPVWEPEQQTVVWDFVDNSEIQSVVTDAGVEYQPVEAPKKQEKVRLTNTALFQNYTANDHKNNNFDDIDYYTVTATVAKALESRGAALLVPDAKCHDEALPQALALVKDPERCASMKQAISKMAVKQAANLIVDQIEQLIKK